MNPAPNLVLVGPMGSGKSSIGRRLAERFGLAFHDADREIEAQAGASIATIFECAGEADFRAREQIVLAGLLAGEGAVIATGGGAVLAVRTRQHLRERGFVRSEEHTSELQSLMRISYAVFCLKKKKRNKKIINGINTASRFTEGDQTIGRDHN